MRAPLATLATLASLVTLHGAEPSPATEATGWQTVPAILARIVPPTFPAQDFPITRFGAVGDGKADATQAIHDAVDACARAGGGRVIVPAGQFVTGAIHLRSHVNLHVEGGATLAFKTDPAAYLPVVFTRWEGVECMNYSSMIHALDQENVAVTGQGTLDAGSDNSNWWRWNPRKKSPGPSIQSADRNQLFAWGQEGVPPEKRVFGEGHFLRPNFIEFNRCKNVLVEGVTILRSPMFEVHPVLCTNVTVRGVIVHSGGPNNDGCDPECCHDVLIEGCVFDTGDDCIAIKSGRNNDGRRVNVPSENIVVRGCTMQDGHGGLTVGSEISGGCRNVFTEDCKMDSPNLLRALRLKDNAQRGGVIENIFMRNVTVGEVADAVVEIDFNYEEGANGPFHPVVRNVVVENVTSRRSMYALHLVGFEHDPIRDVRIVNCTFSDVAEDDVVTNVLGLEKVNVKVERQHATAKPAKPVSE